MLANRDFLVFSDDWGRHPFSCRHLMRRFLSHGNRLLWVHTIGLRSPQLTLYDIRRSWEKIRSWLGPTPQEEQATLPAGLHLLSPPMFPFNRIPGVRAGNRASVARAVLRAMNKLGMRSPILLATLPDAGDYAGAFGECLTVYYCVDDFTLWPKMNQPEIVRDMEEKLLARADLLVAVSDSLCASRARQRLQARLLTHGVDLEHFAQASRPQPVPPELAGVGGRVVGFYGLIDSHFDLEMVQTLLTARPDWRFVCIGTARIDLGPLERLPNFLRLPAVPYERLPALASRFDVAVIPYLVNEHTKTANPLKLREYIATGKPVVATPMPEVFRFAGQLRIAQGAGAFIAAVEAALADPTPPEARLAALAGETWEDKAELLSDWIEETLAARQRRPVRVPGKEAA